MAVTALQLVNRVRRNVGLNADVTSFSDSDESNDNLQDINEAYEELLMALPQETPYLNSSSSLSTVNGTRLYSLTSTAMAFDLYEWSFENETSNDAPLRVVSKEYVVNLDSRWDEVTDEPRFVYPEGDNQIGFYPVPDDAYTIKYSFAQTPSTRASSTSSTFLLPDRWMRFVEKRAQEKYERRKGFQEPDNTRFEALELLAEILAEALDISPVYWITDGF